MRHSPESLSHSNNLDMSGDPEGINWQNKQKAPWGMGDFHSLESLAGEFDSGSALQAQRQSMEKLSQKPIDIFTRKVFELNPSLKTRTENVISSFAESSMRFPYIHITPERIITNDGDEISTGNVENIVQNGFTPRDTNVGGFIVPGRHYSEVGDAGRFKKTEDFLKSYILLMRHYLAHGTRQNHRNSAIGNGKSIPCMVLVNGKLPVEHGTDYEDHFILKNGSSPDDIKSIVRCGGFNPNNEEQIAKSYSLLLDSLENDFN